MKQMALHKFISIILDRCLNTQKLVNIKSGVSLVQNASNLHEMYNNLSFMALNMVWQDER